MRGQPTPINRLEIAAISEAQREDRSFASDRRMRACQELIEKNGEPTPWHERWKLHLPASHAMTWEHLLCFPTCFCTAHALLANRTPRLRCCRWLAPSRLRPICRSRCGQWGFLLGNVLGSSNCSTAISAQVEYSVL